MAIHNDIGKYGENVACDFITSMGYTILERNWRCGHLEVDIIAYSEGVVVFIEVKTRSSVSFGEPESFVDIKKQRAYIRAANQYILSNRRKEEVRFDIISVTLNSSGPKVRHIPNAFNAIVAFFRH